MNPKISIIIPLYNKDKFLTETINSVINQKFSNWQLFIIDDCSTDNSFYIANTFTYDKRISVIRNETNKGANYCRNLGLSKCISEFVVFLDADDILHKNCLEFRFSQATKYPEFQIYVFQMGVFKNSINDDSRLWVPNSSDPLNDFLQHNLPWSILQPLWRLEAIKCVNGFDESFNRLQDVELSTRLLLQKNIKVKQFTGFTDCFYRISTNRVNYNIEDYLNRQIDASIKYYNKFFNLISLKQKNKLLGTLFKIFLICIYHYKKNDISKSSLISFKNQLINNTVKKTNFNSKNKFAFYLFISVNIYIKPVKGFNYLAQKIITG